jgi:uncharacterized repeat protein (TIGR01451 family)
MTILARVDSPVAATNVAVASSSPFDPNLDNNTATSDVVPQQADLAVTKAVSNPKPNLGDAVAFTVTVTNNGPNDATNVLARDLLPAGTTFVTATPSQGFYGPATGLWAVGTVAAGASATLTIQARVTEVGPRVNVVTVIASDQFDPDPNNSQATVTVTAAQADVAVTKTASRRTVVVGQTMSFTIVVSNLGPDPATNVVLADRLPSGLSLVSINQITQGTYDRATGRWTVGTLAPGAVARLRITVRVNRVGNFVNTVTATQDEFDPVLGNNQAAAGVAVRRMTPSKFWFLSGMA